jgi:hypothetical protein
VGVLDAVEVAVELGVAVLVAVEVGDMPGVAVDVGVTAQEPPAAMLAKA